MRKEKPKWFWACAEEECGVYEEKNAEDGTARLKKRKATDEVHGMYCCMVVCMYAYNVNLIKLPVIIDVHNGTK